jgi:hypothetical protein
MDKWSVYVESGLVDIPITIYEDDKIIEAVFSGGPGKGSLTWDLSINNYHQGTLICTEQSGWRYDSQKGHRFEDLTDYFEDVVVAWYG